ncbi:hypothetical protein [Alcaligenes sp. WGS1538]|uniref:hypothetical protein n=1 Tax=Alcaligenes sp. WGS1538 TaxID=3366811 RepID=UPI00372D2BF3
MTGSAPDPGLGAGVSFDRKKKIMFTQTSNIAVPADGQQELVLQLQREDLESCPLGTIGNLKYNKGGTAPARRAGVLLSEMRRSLAARGADFTAYFTGESSEARAQREELAEARANSRRIGNLLGSLTARAFPQPIDPKKLSGIAQALKELNLPPESGLYSLKGARNCLDTYMAELNELDIDALCDGVLSNNSSCEAVLDRISLRPDDPLRIQASRVLGDIKEALNQRLIHDAMHAPLSKVVELLAADPVNALDLTKQLMEVSQDVDAHLYYFATLSTDEFKGLLGVLHSSQNLDVIRQALRQTENLWMEDHVLELLHSLESEFHRRAPDSLHDQQFNLRSALGAGNRLALPDALYRLSLAMEETHQTWGALPDGSVWPVQRLVEDSKNLLRDHQSNPVGPLNWYSLGDLDDGMRKNLDAAAVVLRRFGLKLEMDLESRVC